MTFFLPIAFALAVVLGPLRAAPARADAPYPDSLSVTLPADSAHSTAPGGQPAEPGARTVDDLWVLRTSLVDAEDIPRLVERAKAMGVRALLVQVVGRGDRKSVV